jgi:hypothetical protein
VGEKFEIRNPKSEIPQLGTAGPSTQTAPGYLNPIFSPEAREDFWSGRKQPRVPWWNPGPKTEAVM